MTLNITSSEITQDDLDDWGYEPFKGRSFDPHATTRIHRNLNRRDDVWWSITQHNRVVGHTLNFWLSDARAHVNPTAQARIAAGAAREVHAWVIGKPWNGSLNGVMGAGVVYDPKTSPVFHYYGEPFCEWRNSALVHFDGGGMRDYDVINNPDFWKE